MLTVTLPDARLNPGRYYVIKRLEGDHPIRIVAQLQQTIDGSRAVALEQDGQSIGLVSDGTGWIIVSLGPRPVAFGASAH
jgi:hypothetical protein